MQRPHNLLELNQNWLACGSINSTDWLTHEWHTISQPMFFSNSFLNFRQLDWHRMLLPGHLLDRLDFSSLGKHDSTKLCKNQLPELLPHCDTIDWSTLSTAKHINFTIRIPSQAKALRHPSSHFVGSSGLGPNSNFILTNSRNSRPVMAAMNTD